MSTTEKCAAQALTTKNPHISTRKKKRHNLLTQYWISRLGWMVLFLLMRFAVFVGKSQCKIWKAFCLALRLLSILIKRFHGDEPRNRKQLIWLIGRRWLHFALVNFIDPYLHWTSVKTGTQCFIFSLSHKNISQLIQALISLNSQICIQNNVKILNLMYFWRNWVIEHRQPQQRVTGQNLPTTFWLSSQAFNFNSLSLFTFLLKWCPPTHPLLI